MRVASTVRKLVGDLARQLSALPIAILLLVITWPASSPAQSVWAQGGTSTLLSASGFDVNYKWSPVQGWFSAGFSDGFLVGGYLQTRYRDFDFGAVANSRRGQRLPAPRPASAITRFSALSMQSSQRVLFSIRASSQAA